MIYGKYSFEYDDFYFLGFHSAIWFFLKQRFHRTYMYVN